MSSPVDTSVKHYRSDMPGAPVENGVPGSKIARLEACLCTGYGLKAVTSLVVAGGIATLTFAGGASAAWPEAVILVAGAANAALNGEQKVLSANTTTVTFATDEPDGTDSGTVTFKIAPAGWEKVYSKTGVAVFRSLQLESTRMFLRVDDTNAQFVRVVGYESMSDVDTGVGAFPTAAQKSGGGYWAKSDTASATPVAWILASDGQFFYDSPAPGSHRGMTYQACQLRGFGDLIAKNPAGDAYLCALNFSATATVTSMNDGQIDGGSDLCTALARGFTGLGTAVLSRRHPYVGNSSSGNYSGQNDITLGAFPSPIDGSLLLSEQYVSDAGAPRGDIPGSRYCPQTGVWASFKMFDTLMHSGRKFICSTASSVGSNNPSVVPNSGASFIDITGPWRA